MDLHDGAEHLRKLWTEQLYREYDYVRHQYRVHLRTPVIRIERLGSRWATWDPMARTITINPRLIEDHSWDAVIEILKHEMAHQLVSENRGTAHLHGPDFAEACRILRVAGWATTASGEIPDLAPGWKSRALGDEEEKLLRRVEKLLSLAGSSNEHEALLAMQRVQELYARHDIDRLKARREASMVTLTIDLHKKRVDRLTSMACSILQEHFFVRVIYGSVFNAKDLCTYRNVELVGTRANVTMAEYVYHFLQDKLAELWEEYRRRSGVEGRARRDYMFGVLEGFRRKLAADRARVIQAAAGGIDPAQTTALVAVGARELDRYVEYLFPRLVHRHFSTGYSDAVSYAAGVEEGGRIVLNRPVEEQRGNRGGLLPG